MNPNPVPVRGFSLVGMLIALVCILVLSTIGLTALNKAVTGEGSAVDGTVHSFQDKFALQGLHASLMAHASDHRGRFLTPSLLTEKASDDTTANLFSLMIMQGYVQPEQLLSANEFSGYVDADEDYDYRVYSPRNGVYWDPSFVADLSEYSNTSYAHVPLFGTRFERHWNADLRGTCPILGNRGPKDGIDDPMSFTYGRNGQWGGHLLFANGQVEFVRQFSPPSVYFERGGERYADNVYAMEDGPAGADAILAFTSEMTEKGPVLQWD